MSDDIIANLLRPDFHAVNFEFKGKHYTISGWWRLEIIPDLSDFSKSIILHFDDIQTLLESKAIDGFSLYQISCQVEIIDYDFDPI